MRNCVVSMIPNQRRRKYLQQVLQKRAAIRPFVHIIECVETLLYLLRVFLVLRIRRV